MTRLDDFKVRKIAEYADKADFSDIDSVSTDIKTLYETRQRCRISDGTYTSDGYVSVTTGWRPAFIHVYNRRSAGSPNIIDKDAKVVRIFKTRI